jgi:hypothetical protein
VIDQTELESAKSSHVYSITRTMSTNLEAAERSYVVEFLEGLPRNYPIRLLNEAGVFITLRKLMG